MADQPKEIAPPAGQVPVYVPGLGVRTVDAKDAAVAKADGARKATAHEYTHAKKEAEYSGIEGHVAPALAGAARGLTLGASDVALSGIGGEALRNKLAEYQEYSPTASSVGELGGIAAGALLGDEAGLGALPGAVGRLGAGVGRGVAEGLGGGLLARGAGALAHGAVEGAIYSAGQKAGDSAIRNEDLTAESILAAAGHGALLGAGANAALGGVAKLAGHGLDSLGGLARRGVDAESGAASSSLGEYLQRASDTKTIKALGGSAGDLRSLESRVPGGYQRVAQDVRADLETSTGKSIGLHNKESLNEYATQRVEELGDQLGKQLKQIDQAGVGHAPDVKGFVKQVRDELITPHTVETPTGTVVKPGRAESVHAAEKWISEVEAAFGHKPPTFSEWQAARVDLDKQISFAARNASPAMDTLKQVRGIMEKELERSGEAAAQSMGTSFADQYQATKSLYQSVRSARDLTERGVAAERARNSMGLGATLGSLTGFATGGPLVGGAMGIAGKLIKDRGDQLAADLLDRAAGLAGVRKLAARTDDKLREGVAKLVGAKPAGEPGLPSPKSGKPGPGFFTKVLERAPIGQEAVALGAMGGSKRKQFDEHAASVASMASNPQALTAHVGDALGHVATASPRVAQASTTVALRGIAYLNSVMPNARKDPFTLQPQLEPASRASDSEISRHMRIVEALDNPTMILGEAMKGTLTRDHVDAVKAVYPQLYQQMQEQVMRGLVDSKSPLPYGRRIQLGVLLDIPTDKTLSPEFISAIQKTYAAAPEGDGAPPAVSSAHPLQIANSFSTATQLATEGMEK